MGVKVKPVVRDIDIQVLKYYIQYSEEHGIMPSMREVCSALDITSPAALRYYNERLVSNGYISVQDGVARSVKVLRNPSGTPYIGGSENTIMIPLVGKVAAGIPILATQNIDCYCRFPMEDFDGKETYYSLRVHGDSMINAGIFDNDMVIVKKTDDAEEGQIIVALIDDEATVKRYYTDGANFVLKAENPNYQPIITNRLKIQGIVVGVYRIFDKVK